MRKIRVRDVEFCEVCETPQFAGDPMVSEDGLLYCLQCAQTGSLAFSPA